jgi:membrane protein
MTRNAKSRFKDLWDQKPTFATISQPVRLIFKFLVLFKRAFWLAFEHDAYTIAKASAYSCILTFFPALLVLGAVLTSSQRFEIYIREISYVLGRMLPAGSNAAVHYLRSNDHRPIGFLITTSLLTVWLASGVVVSWMEGFRNAYQLPKIWGLVKERAIACALVILAGIPMTIATILVAFGGQIENRAMVLIGHHLGPLILLMWSGIRWLVAILTSIAVIAVIYHNAVPRTQRWHSVLPGASLATGMWFSATVLFGWYVNRYGEYSEIYGPLAVGIALLIWMFLISLIVLVGAEFNAFLFPRAVPRRPVAEENHHWRSRRQKGHIVPSR